MQQLTADTIYQEELARFQKIKLIRSVFIDALIPALVFASIVFMPLGIGIGMLAVGFALAGLSKTILNQYEPHHGVFNELEVKEDGEEMKKEPSIFPEFNEQAYKEFAKNPSIDYFHSHRFFSPKTESDHTNASDNDIQFSNGR